MIVLDKENKIDLVDHNSKEKNVVQPIEDNSREVSNISSSEKVTTDVTSEKNQSVEDISKPSVDFENMSLSEQLDARKSNWSVALAPHLRTNKTTQKIMLDVIIALTPQMLFSVYKFEFNAAILIILSVLSAVFSEYAIQKLFNKKVMIFVL